MSQQPQGEFDAIPLIDVGPFVSWRQGTTAKHGALEVVKQIDRASRNVGFMVFVNTSVPDSVMDAALEAAKAFFGSSLEHKLSASSKGDANYRGYEQCGDGKEAWEMGTEQIPPNVTEEVLPLHGPNRWPIPAPDNATAFRKAIAEYYESMTNFARIVTCAFCMALGLQAQEMEHAVSHPLAHLRLWRYAKEHEDGSLPEHTDHGFLTLLLQDGGGGLQARNRAGAWVDVPTIPHAIVLNSGRLLSRWTNGVYPATFHRVLNRADGDRYSLPFFLAPNYHSIISPLACCISEKRPSQYDAVMSGEYVAAGYAWQGAVNAGEASATDAAAAVDADYEEHEANAGASAGADKGADELSKQVREGEGGLSAIDAATDAQTPPSPPVVATQHHNADNPT